MSLYISDFLDGRIDEIMQNLRKHSSEYALALQRSNHLYEHIAPIIHNKNEDLLICDGDCTNLLEYLDCELTTNAIMQQELYKQGYLDCVKLLGMLGVLGQ